VGKIGLEGSGVSTPKTHSMPIIGHARGSMSLDGVAAAENLKVVAHGGVQALDVLQAGHAGHRFKRDPNKRAEDDGMRHHMILHTAEANGAKGGKGAKGAKEATGAKDMRFVSAGQKQGGKQGGAASVASFEGVAAKILAAEARVRAQIADAEKQEAAAKMATAGETRQLISAEDQLQARRAALRATAVADMNRLTRGGRR
jgi:hypothetical protein